MKFGTGAKRIHPTEKPVELMRLLIELVTSKGDSILDPFAGGGSTGVAAVEMDRAATLIELNEDMFSKCAKRIDNAKWI